MRSARTINNNVRVAGGDKREAISRAAIRVFANNGYFNSKVADIAREAGVADGTAIHPCSPSRTRRSRPT